MTKLKCLNCDSPDCPMEDPHTVMNGAEAMKVCALNKIGEWLQNLTYEVQQIRHRGER